VTFRSLLRALFSPTGGPARSADAMAPCDARLDVMPCPICGAYVAFDRPPACDSRDCPWRQVRNVPK
jgi:hypothetical protein